MTGTDGAEGEDAGFGTCVPIEPGQPGGPGGDPNDGDDPVECDLDADYDNCTPGDVCVDGQSVLGGDRCIPHKGSLGTRFGCCKSHPVAVDDPNNQALEGNDKIIKPLPNDFDPGKFYMYHGFNHIYCIPIFIHVLKLFFFFSFL